MANFVNFWYPRNVRCTMPFIKTQLPLQPHQQPGQQQPIEIVVSKCFNPKQILESTCLWLMGASYNSSKLKFVALGTHVGACSQRQIDNIICQSPCLLCIWSSQCISRNYLALSLDLELEHFTLKVDDLFKLLWNASCSFDEQLFLKFC